MTAGGAHDRTNFHDSRETRGIQEIGRIVAEVVPCPRILQTFFDQRPKGMGMFPAEFSGLFRFCRHRFRRRLVFQTRQLAGEELFEGFGEAAEGDSFLFISS